MNKPMNSIQMANRKVQKISFIFLILFSLNGPANGMTINYFSQCMGILNSLILQPEIRDGKISKDFNLFLESRKSSPVSSQAFRRNVFGGKKYSNSKIKKTPVIFIHGNSDAVMGHGFPFSSFLPFTGWQKYIRYFKNKKYTNAEIYGFSWGHQNPFLATLETHSHENILKIREFVLAVLEYTGAEKVQIVSHSMGVTMSAKAIIGGELTVPGDITNLTYHLGNDISDRIDSFVGIAGAFRGIENCRHFPFIPTCNMYNGLHPDSLLIQDLNTANVKFADRSLSVWSRDNDEILQSSNAGEYPSSRIPNQSNELVFERDHRIKGSRIGHWELKDSTVALIYKWLNEHHQ